MFYREKQRPTGSQVPIYRTPVYRTRYTYASCITVTTVKSTVKYRIYTAGNPMKTSSRFIVRDLIPTRDDNDLFIKTISILWYRSKVKYFQNFPNHTCNDDCIHVAIPFVALM